MSEGTKTIDLAEAMARIEVLEARVFVLEAVVNNLERKVIWPDTTPATQVAEAV